MAVKQLKDGRWIVYGRPGFFPDPKRRREYFGRGIEAEKRARIRNDELSSSKKSKPLPPVGHTLSALAKLYRDSKNFRPKSKRELGYRLTIILEQLGHRIATRIDHAALDQYVAHRRAQKAKRKKTTIKDSTIRREITDIKAILNWANKRQPPLINFNPIANYQAPAPDDEVILPPSPSEAERIYVAAAPHLKRAITLSWYLGLRPGAVELLSLNWATSVQAPLLPDPWEKKAIREKKYKHIDELIANVQIASAALGVIRIRSAHKGGPQLRDVHIHPGLFIELRTWHQADMGKGPLIHYHGRAITKIQKSWAGALKRAKIDRRLRPYDLRHAFATMALESGADIGAVAGIMGSSPETIRRHYQHVSTEATRKTVELIPSFSSAKK
jgi:integrase